MHFDLYYCRFVHNSFFSCRLWWHFVEGCLCFVRNSALALLRGGCAAVGVHSGAGSRKMLFASRFRAARARACRRMRLKHEQDRA